jgi:hypothetical protein
MTTWKNWSLPGVLLEKKSRLDFARNVASLFCVRIFFVRIVVNRSINLK